MINCALPVCSTEQGRVPEVYRAKYAVSSSVSSCLLSTQVCNLHCCWRKTDTVLGKKKKKRDKRVLSLCCIRLTPTWIINRVKMCSDSCGDTQSYQNQWQWQQHISLYVSPMPTTHDFSYCFCFLLQALILSEAPPHIPCSCNNPVARL